MVSESSRVHMSAIPLGEMRRCTFCGSRLRAWYLLVGNTSSNDPCSIAMLVYWSINRIITRPTYQPLAAAYLTNP